MLLQPAGEHLAILLVSIDEAGVAGASEQVPLALGDVLVERGGHDRGTDVARATADKCWLRNLVQTVGVLEVLQIAERLILVGSPAIEVGFRA